MRLRLQLRAAAANKSYKSVISLCRLAFPWEVFPAGTFFSALLKGEQQECRSPFIFVRKGEATLLSLQVLLSLGKGFFGVIFV